MLFATNECFKLSNILLGSFNKYVTEKRAFLPPEIFVTVFSETFRNGFFTKKADTFVRLRVFLSRESSLNLILNSRKSFSKKTFLLGQDYKAGQNYKVGHNLLSKISRFFEHAKVSARESKTISKFMYPIHEMFFY